MSEMNKSELLAYLGTKYYKLGTLEAGSGDSSVDTVMLAEGAKIYRQGVYEKPDIGGIRKQIIFYVLNEGEANEEAFEYNGRTSAFRELVETLIGEKIADDTILKGVITHINEQKRFAEVVVYLASGADAQRKTYLAYEDKVQAMQFELLV